MNWYVAELSPFADVMMVSGEPSLEFAGVLPNLSLMISLKKPPPFPLAPYLGDFGSTFGFFLLDEGAEEGRVVGLLLLATSEAYSPRWIVVELMLFEVPLMKFDEDLCLGVEGLLSSEPLVSMSIGAIFAL